MRLGDWKTRVLRGFCLILGKKCVEECSEERERGVKEEEDAGATMEERENVSAVIVQWRSNSAKLEWP